MEMQQTTNYKLEAGLNASLELQASRDHERTKTRQGRLRGRPRGPQGYEIGAKQYDKEETLFWTSKRKKKQARKMDLPSKRSCDFLFVARVGLCC